jgi:hypothetical protein
MLCLVDRRIVLTAFRMGELEPWVDENFIRSLWYGMGEQVNVKMIRDKFTGSVEILNVLRHGLLTLTLA